MTPKIHKLNHSLFLVDTSSLIFRAFYAIPPLTSPKGQPVNALYGFVNMVTKLLKDYSPDKIIFCYDSKEKGERYLVYPEYKANRGSMPEDLSSQIPLIKECIKILGFPSYEISGVEADDIIGTLTLEAQRHDESVVIVSSDKDFAQLINPQVSMYDTMKDLFIDEEQAIKKWGLHPKQMIDYLALIGDSSDNIPGVNGIGPKTAIKLLEQYQNLDLIFENINEIKGTLKEKLIASKEMAYLSQSLVTIKKDIPLSFDLNSIKQTPPDYNATLSWFEPFNFKNINQLLSIFQKKIQTSPESQTPSNNNDSLENLKTYPVNSPKDINGHLWTSSPVWVLEWNHFWIIAQDNTIFTIDQNEFIDFSFLTTLKIKSFQAKKILHKINSDNIEITWDSALAAYLINPGHDIKEESLFITYLSENTFIETPEMYLTVHKKLESELNKLLEHHESLYHTVEIPTLNLLYKMEKRGILIDSEWLLEERTRLFNEIQEIEAKIYHLTESQFNIASPKQLAQILFEKLKLPTVKKTKTGFSTDNEVLEQLKNSHPSISEILNYRELAKLKSTYVDPLPQLMDQKGRIHTTFQQMTTATGRLSSINPNLQNIPIRTERGERLRRCFITEPGFLMASFDYSQIELRILAHMSGDANLTDAFHNGVDIHNRTASEIFNLSLNEIKPEHRRIAKAVNFGIAYGQSAFGLSQTLGISRKEAQEIIDKYFKRFNKVEEYIQSTISKARVQGYIETLFGRRRYLPELSSKNVAIQKFGERAAINAPIQGSAADIVKIAMLEVSKNSSLFLLLQVHDELILEGVKEKVIEEAQSIKEIMQNAVKLNVPLDVHYGIGNNWSDCHK